MKADVLGIGLNVEYQNIVEHPFDDNFGPMVIHDEHRI